MSTEHGIHRKYLLLMVIPSSTHAHTENEVSWVGHYTASDGEVSLLES